MVRRRAVLLPLTLASILLLLTTTPVAEAQPHTRGTWNYDGGLLMMTDGSIPHGPCFRLSGHASAPNYFENLKREDTGTGTVIHRGHDIVTEYPAQLHVSFLMYDLPCDYDIKHASTRTYLTRAMVGELRLSFFWKQGLKLRPAPGPVLSHFEVRRLPTYAGQYVTDVPEKLEWEFEFDIPSEGVPVTDSLVVVLLTPDGHIAARAAARM